MAKKKEVKVEDEALKVAEEPKVVKDVRLPAAQRVGKKVNLQVSGFVCPECGVQMKNLGLGRVECDTKGCVLHDYVFALPVIEVVSGIVAK